MRSTAVLSLFALLPVSAFGQMTTQQKLDDFNGLVARYDKDYAFYQWKRDAIGFDLLKIQPWLDRVSASTDDIGFYEIAAQYVGSLKDGHDLYENPSNFTADLRFDVDLYDGKALVDGIDPNALPPSQYNIQIGDEVVSVDGKTPQDFITDYSKYIPLGTVRSTQRYTVGFVSFRPQAVHPLGADVGDTAAVVLRGSDGNLKTLTIPWVKNGTFLTNIGPVPNPDMRRARRLSRKEFGRSPHPKPPAPGSSTPTTPAQKFYANLTQRFQLQRKPDTYASNSLGYLGSLYPPYLYALIQSNFQFRLGEEGDYFFSGTYTSGPYTIGLIRIPDFEASADGYDFDTMEAAVAQFQTEIGFMKQNTDGLVVDVTNNPGGYGFYCLQLLDRLTDKAYRQSGYQVRPQYYDIESLSELLAEADGFLDQWQIDLLTAYRNELQTAYQSDRGMTGPLPIDFGWSLDPADTSSLSFTHLPVQGADGKPAGYDKPVILLADDSSFSAAEVFAGSFQDSHRGPVVGYITGGLGGAREDTNTGIYSEAYTSVTVAQLLRAQPIKTSTYPAAAFIENIGVIPDVTLDFMTADNLNTGGVNYFNSFTQTLTGLLPKK